MRIKWKGVPSEAPAQKKVFEPGVQYEVSDESGRTWVAAGVAEVVRQPRVKADETAEKE